MPASAVAPCSRIHVMQTCRPRTAWHCARPGGGRTSHQRLRRHPTGPATPPPRSSLRQRGHSHTGPGGQRPHCRTAKKITGGVGDPSPKGISPGERATRHKTPPPPPIHRSVRSTRARSGQMPERATRQAGGRPGSGNGVRALAAVMTDVVTGSRDTAGRQSTQSPQHCAPITSPHGQPAGRAEGTAPSGAAGRGLRSARPQ